MNVPTDGNTSVLPLPTVRSRLAPPATDDWISQSISESRVQPRR